jgi:hypothetical protein
LDHTSRGKDQLQGAQIDPRSLPCLNSNISTEIHPDRGTGGEAGSCPRLAPLSTQHRKSAFVLKESVQQMADRYGLENLGFLTLTFAQHITCPREAQRRLNSLITHVIKVRYLDYVGVMERQKSGRIHYHLLVALGQDIRTGFDFSAIAKQDYTSASPALRSEWAFWRSTARKYRFGRTELLPVKSSTEAMAKYLGKYISKHMEARCPDDKGVRLVRYSKGARAGTTRFQFQSQGSAEWRRKLAIFAQIIQERHPEQKVGSIADLTRVLGKRWAHRHRDIILAIP